SGSTVLGEHELVLAGPPSPHTEEIRARALELGASERVRFLGSVPEARLGTLIREADALVLVSFVEGIGLPPLEAMSVGVPVVVSDIPVLREVCGDAAWYADPSNAESIAAALEAATRSGAGREARLAQA